VVSEANEWGNPDCDSDQSGPCPDFEVTVQPVRLQNSHVMANLHDKVSHLPEKRGDEIVSLVNEFRDLFPDVPGRARGISHDVDVGDARPIKQHPYPVGPEKRAIIEREIKYMLDNRIIEESSSAWSSPCLVQQKPDKSWRFITDFRRVNDVTKADSFPLPRIQDLIDEVGNAKYVTKFDLLKGYWQIPLTERAKDVSSFCTASGLYRYLVSPFGMKNSGSTFQRFMNHIVTEHQSLC